MTREEKVKNLLTELIDMVDNGSQRDLDRADEIGASIIKLLEQEPCKDCISRQAALELFTWTNTKEDIWYGLKLLPSVAIPSVNPQEPINKIVQKAYEDGKKDGYVQAKDEQENTGHWIEEIDDYGEIQGWHCDKCYEDSGFTTECKWDFCPNCGARMIEPQERSE